MLSFTKSLPCGASEPRALMLTLIDETSVAFLLGVFTEKFYSSASCVFRLIFFTFIHPRN